MKRSRLFRYRRVKIKFICKILDYFVLRTIKLHKPKIIAITGTIGKTSAKLAISQLLSKECNVHIEKENHNSDRGIRLSFFGLEFPHKSRTLLYWLPVIWHIYKLSKKFPFDIVVLEMAESRHESLNDFVQKIQPDIAVVTGIAPAHMRYFKTTQAIENAVYRLSSHGKKVVYNADVKNIASHFSDNNNSTGYGLKQGAIVVYDATITKDGLVSAKLDLQGKKYTIDTKFVAKHSLYGLVAAIAVASELGWQTTHILPALKNITPLDGRMNPLRGKKNSLLLDDSFNASPTTVLAALETLKLAEGYKIAVLGSMNQLGTESIAQHQAVGKEVARIADVLITVGSEAKKYLAPAAHKAGLSSKNIYSFKKSNMVEHCLKTVLKPNSVVLFKGSQGKIYIEEAIKSIMLYPEQAKDVLVRQDGVWLRRKKGYFA